MASPFAPIDVSAVARTGGANFPPPVRRHVNRATREELIDAYYRAVDADDPASLRSVFSADATHTRPGQGTLDGLEAIVDFYGGRRLSRETVHRVDGRFHGDDVTLCTVHVEGHLPEGPFEGDVVAEFTFDEDAGRIASYRVYRGYER